MVSTPGTYLAVRVSCNSQVYFEEWTETVKVLVLAPEPFYQERGTPIAVSLILRALSERGDEVDLLTYNEGDPYTLPGLTIYRIPDVIFLRHVRPGPSWKKLIGTLLVLFKALALVRKKRYSIIHSVEESVFVALLLKFFFRSSICLRYGFIDAPANHRQVSIPEVFVPFPAAL